MGRKEEKEEREEEEGSRFGHQRVGGEEDKQRNVHLKRCVDLPDREINGINKGITTSLRLNSVYCTFQAPNR